MTDTATGWTPTWLDALARRAVRESLGSGARVTEVATLQISAEAAVLHLAVRGVPEGLVLKVAATSAGPALDLGRSASAMRRAAAAGVPVPEVLSADGIGTLDGVQHLLQRHAGGRPWREVRPLLDQAGTVGVHAQLVDVLTALATVRLDGYGELGADGGVRAQPLATALRRRVALRTRRPAARALAERLLAENPDRLGDGPAVLSHDDLHHANVLVDPASARVVAVLDWDKAWAGPAVADVARVVFWDDMPGRAWWPGRQGAEDDIVLRLHQLLWCLEHAFPTARHRADTARLLRSFGLPVPPDLG